jgi:CheY-like chemotaxis protein
MSALQNFLAPFSHLLFANRNLTIGLLCFVLFLVALDALIHRWHRKRLEHELAKARSSGSQSTGRRYASGQAPEEASAESGVLPPVKGGRTYARNLGTALQKAGMAAPQIYSPPTPPGWAQNAGAAQPVAPPPPPQPYAAPNVPWATQPATPASPWGFPPGAGRTLPPGAPSNPVQPYYQPQPSPPPPVTPPASVPGLYGPPGAAYTPPSFQPATSGAPQAPAPGTLPALPSATPAPPAFGQPPIQPEPVAEEGTRRGKPKRRRFTFNVLENLEKMVQQRAPEAGAAAVPQSWTPPAAPMGPVPSMAPAPAAPKPGLRAPHPTPMKVGPPAPIETAEEASLPLRFGPEREAEAEPELTAALEAEPAAQVEAEPVASGEEESESVAAASAEAEVEPPVGEPEKKPEPRRSMRSMLFGEEPPSRGASDTEAEPALSRHEPVWPQSTPSPDPWAPAEATDEATATDTTAADEAAFPSEADAGLFRQSTDGTDVEPVSTSTENDYAAEPQPDPLVASEPEPATVAEMPEPPAQDFGDKPSAGTLVIIEDDQTAASYYATLFRGNGYRVEVANDGVSGVDLCARVQPQVILLDVMMPRQNGILVLQTLRASDETKNTPVVVMSNFSEPTLIKRAIQLGALEYVIKTQVEGPALLNALPRWMNREKAFAAA